MAYSSTSGTKIIRNRAGERLRLGAGKLQQIDHAETGVAWFVTAADFRKAYRTAEALPIPAATVKIKRAGGEQYSLFVAFVLPNSGIRSYGDGYGQIGCCYFSPDVFKLFVRKFRARKTQARTAKVGA